MVSSSENIQDLSTNISIRIKLSDEGYNNYEKIISIVLSYINYLQKEEIHKDFYEEIKQLSEIDFFLDIQNDPIDFCENVSRDLNLLKPNEPYYISSKIEEYKPDLLKEILNSLTPQNLNIYLLSNKLQTEKEYLENKNLYNTEKIYGTEYMKIKKNFSKYIADIKSFPDSDLGYPELNPFIAKDLSMIDLVKENINLDEFKYPKKMWDKDSIIWYKPVVKYKIPKVYIVGKAYISNMNLNFETFYIYIEIFNKLIEKENSDFNYFGTISENSFSISCGISSIHIKASGYSDSLEKYITEYFKILSKFVEIQKIENIISKLNKILDEQINSAKNFYLGDVGTQTKKNALFILKKLKVLNKIEIYENFRKDLDQNKIPEEFLFCIKNFLKKVKYEWLVEGNILYKNVEKIIQKIETELYNLFGGKKQEHKEPLSINEIRKQREVKLPCDKIYRYNFCSKDPKNESSTMLVFFQTVNANFNDKNAFNPQLYENYIKIFCLNYIMFYIFNELFYEILRTKEQLGYDVSFSTETNNNIFGFKFYVSSSKYNPDEILERINKFIVDNDLNKEDNFSDENFESYKKSMLVDLMEKPLTLESEMGRDLAYIFDRSYTFDERLKMIKYTNEKLTKKDVIDYFNEFIFLKAKRLEVALYSSVNKEKEKEENKMDIEENDNIKNEKEVKEESNIDMVEVKKRIKMKMMKIIIMFYLRIKM